MTTMTTESVDECAQRLVRDEVLVCLSSLIYELNNNDVARHLHISDEMFELSGQSDYEEAARMHASQLGRDDLLHLLEAAGVNPALMDDHDADLAELLVKQLKHLDELRSFCGEHGIEPEHYEAYEHWAVTEWFAHKLRDQGETVVELFNMNIWGRCTTGQMIYMDSVLNRIAADLLS
ncbi:hypothetical protein [Cupriavidus necator]